MAVLKAHWVYKLQTLEDDIVTLRFNSNEGKKYKTINFFFWFFYYFMSNIWVISKNFSSNGRARRVSVVICSYWFSCWIPGSLCWLLPIYSTSMFIYHFDQKNNFGGHLLIPSLEKITSNSFLNKKGLWVTWITLALRDMSLTLLSCLICSISSHSPNLKQK